MNPSIRLLREKLKEEIANLLENHNNIVSEDWTNKSMIDIWRSATKIVFFIDQSELIPLREEHNQAYHLCRRVVRAGNVYYYAKKHGIQAALIFRLSSDA